MLVRAVTLAGAGILAFSAIASTRPMEASLQKVFVRLHGVRRDVDLPISLSVARDDGKGVTRRAAIQIAQNEDHAEAEFDLDPGTVWSFTADKEGFFSEVRSVGVKEGSEPVVLDLWPSGLLIPDLLPSKGNRPPKQLSIRFGFAPEAKAKEPLPGSWFDCDHIEEGWSCEVPAGVVDIELRVPGFISHFLWGVKIPEGGRVKVPNVVLRPGASLIGRVQGSNGVAPSMKSCQVILEPLRLGHIAAGGSSQTRQDLALRSTTINERGFFHFDAVLPGAYVVWARQDGSAPARRSVTVMADREAELKEPLTLTPPFNLELFVSPPRDARGQPWVIEVAERNGLQMESICSAAVKNDGAFRCDRIARGRTYRAVVRSSVGEGWWTTEFDGDAAPIQKSIEITLEAVSGRVMLGKRPLSSEVRFGGRDALIWASLNSNDEGLFSGFLPSLGKWDVLIRADGAEVNRQTWVDVRRDAESGSGRAEIILPGTSLSGEIVDEKGDRAPDAILKTRTTATPPERSELLVREGTFQLDGLPVGAIELTAISRDSETPTVSVMLEENANQPQFVRLVLRRQDEIRGRVVSASGFGIGGAVIQPLPPLGSVGSTTPARVTTDADGSFTTKISPGQVDVGMVVMAGGYATRALRVPVGGNRLLQIDLEQTGGRLVAEMPALSISAAAPSPRFVRLLHGGCSIPPLIFSLVGAYSETTSNGRSKIAIANLEPGEYTICLSARNELLSPFPGSGCATATLAAFGETSLVLR